MNDMRSVRPAPPHLILLVAPILGGQLSSFIESVPGNVTKLQALLSDPSQPWIQKALGAGFSADKSIGDLMAQGVSWLTAFLHSLWSGGRALVSVFSLVVVTPVVAFYLIYDWHRMIRTVDGWIPVQQRDTVRALALEIDAAISGFVRGQSGVCLILGSFYALALTLVGLNFGLLIGLISGLITFIPYVGSMTGLMLAVTVAVVNPTETPHELKLELPKEIKRARELGDLRENAEYQAAKERQRLVESRISMLQKRVAEIAMINVDRIPKDRAGFGSTVHVVEGTGEKLVFQLVMPEDADAAKGLISTTSPIGRAFLNKEPGDSVKVDTPGGKRQFEIVKLFTIHDEAAG
jgi:transcription elongation GreA/GreB family factor